MPRPTDPAWRPLPLNCPKCPRGMEYRGSPPRACTCMTAPSTASGSLAQGGCTDRKIWNGARRLASKHSDAAPAVTPAPAASRKRGFLVAARPRRGVLPASAIPGPHYGRVPRACCCCPPPSSGQGPARNDADPDGQSPAGRLRLTIRQFCVERIGAVVVVGIANAAVPVAIAGSAVSAIRPNGPMPLRRGDRTR